MKIDFLSDLHLDFFITSKNPDDKKAKKQILEFIDYVLKNSPGDILILAGDLGHYNVQTKLLLIELKKIYKNILVTFGNHDMYMISNSIISKYKGKSENRLIELEEICKELDVHYLNGQVVDVEGIRIGGTGSWYDLPLEEDIVRWNKVMNDSNLIYNGYRKTEPSMYSYGMPKVNTNWNTQKFWDKEYSKLLDIAREGCDIFVTHIGLHYPPDDIMYPEYVGDKNNMFYYTNSLSLLKQSGCKVHIHGHTHQYLDYEVDGIRIRCNPLGYAGENPFCMIQQIEI